MKLWAFLGAAALFGVVAEARAQYGVPSEARLAEMGLAGIEILSEPEAETVRVYGRSPNPWGNLYPFVKGVSRLDREQARTPFLLR
jgi:hypothetical protein